MPCSHYKSSPRALRCKKKKTKQNKTKEQQQQKQQENQREKKAQKEKRNLLHLTAQHQSFQELSKFTWNLF